jgi:alpha-N-arabinofuranosidase
MMGFADREKMFRIASGPAGGDYNWTEVLLKAIPQHLMEGIALHYYAVIDWNKKGPSKDFTEEHYFTTLQRAWQMDEYVRGHKAVMDKYDPEKKLALVVDEWGGWYDVEPGTNPGFLYQQNTVRDAMIAGMTLNIFNNNSDRVRMANLAQTINVLQAVILTDKEKMILTPTYHVMEMYNVHHDAQLLPLEVKSADYVYKGQKLPAVNGSASKDAKGATNISLVNIDAGKAQKVTINIDGKVYKNVSGRILASPKIQDHNTFENGDKIKPVVFNGAKLSGKSLEVTLPPASVVVLQLL